MAAIKPRAVGLSWVRRDDYSRFLEVMEDAHIFPATYDAWAEKAERQQRNLEARGFAVIRAVLDPDEFLAWCATRGMHVNAEARRLFAAAVAMQHVENPN
jgi:hypothetical protein